MPITASFDRPVAATLAVVTEHGEQWDAEDADVRQFGYVKRQAVVSNRATLERLLGIDLSDHEHDAPDSHQPVWEAVNLALHLVESATIYEHRSFDDDETREQIARLARLLGVLEPDAS